MNIKLPYFRIFIALILTVWALALPFKVHAQDRLVFDYYVGGTFQGTIPGVFTDDWIAIDSPRTAAERIPNLRDLGAISELLTGKIPAGSGRTLPGVGNATASPYDFRIDVTIDQSQLLFQKIEKSAKVGLPSDNFSVRVGARATGSTDFESHTDENLTLSKNVTISKGRWRSNLSGSFDEGAGYNLTTFNVEHDVGQRTYSAGMLSTDGTLFSNSQQFYGLELESNLAAITNISDYTASAVEVFIPTHSKVKVFRGESQLIFSRTLEFGLQELDTTRFPTGSYPIKIVIEEDDGTITEERLRFTKSSRIAAFDNPSYAFQLGMTRNEEELLSTPVFQFTRNWRYKDNLGLEVTLYGTPEILLTETKINGLWDDYTFEAALDTTTDSDLAIFGTASYNNTNSPWNWNLTGYHTISGFERDSQTLSEGNEFDKNINTARSYITGYLSYGYKDFNYKITGSYTDKTGDAPIYSYGPSLSWNAYNKNNHSIKTQFRYLGTSTGTFAELTANYKWRPNLKWEAQSNISRLRRNSKDVNNFQQSLRYTNRVNSTEGIDAFVRNTYSKGNTHSNVTNLELLSVGKHVQSRWNGQERSSYKKKNETSLDLEAQTNLLFTKDGLTEEPTQFSMSPESLGEANLIIELNGDAKNTEMEILVNGKSQGFGRVGETVTIGLAPYRDYAVTLQPKDAKALYRYSTEPYNVTLYPGNIEKVEWDVNRLILVLGRMINLTGAPLEWENIKGLESLFTTDGSGNFQLEMAVGESAYIQSTQNSCTIALPPMPKTEYFFHIGDIVCG